MEQWKYIPGYEGLYQASNQGRVRSVDRIVSGRWGNTKRRGKILKPVLNGPGYLQVVLCREKPISRRVHKLIAETWLGSCPQGAEICHNDGNKLNNKVSNLRYDTRSNNNLDKRLHGTRQCKQVLADGKLFASITEAAHALGLSKSFVSAVCNGTRISTNHKLVFP